jgi:hypothetical protein
MSETAQTTITERPTRKLGRKTRQTTALAMSLGALGGLAAPAAHAELTAPKRAGVEHIQPGLKNPAELPGTEIHLGQEILDQIKSSTVELGLRYRHDLVGGSTYAPFSPNCTAVRVSVPGVKDALFATAAHCFSNLTGSRSGGLRDAQNPNLKAENFTAVSDMEYAILDPSEPELDQRSNQPVAIVDRISISTDYKDIALLHIKNTGHSLNSSVNIRKLSEIPALPLKALKQAPLPGTPVAMYGEPQASGFEPVSGTGTYLGRVVYNYTDDYSGESVTRMLDMVGITADAPELDKCNFGASGSVAELPDGQILGNLSTRVTLGYGPEHTMQFGDISLEDNLYWLNQWENQTGINMEGFTTVCGFTVINAKTPAHLVKGFKVTAGGKGAASTTTP